MPLLDIHCLTSLRALHLLECIAPLVQDQECVHLLGACRFRNHSQFYHASGTSGPWELTRPSYRPLSSNIKLTLDLPVRIAFASQAASVTASSDSVSQYLYFSNLLLLLRITATYIHHVTKQHTPALRLPHTIAARLICAIAIEPFFSFDFLDTYIEAITRLPAARACAGSFQLQAFSLIRDFHTL